MSSSVLRNVIQPRSTPSSISRSGADDIGDPNEPPQDMELILGVLVENAPVAMAMFDKNMRYVLANRSWMEEFGLTGMPLLIGRSQYEVFPGLHPGWRQVYDRALQGHVVRSEHDALSGPNGTRIIYRWEVRPWRRQSDATVGGLMVTCERFGQSKVTEPEGQESNVTNTGDEAGQFMDCALPMVLIGEEGVVKRANQSAARLCLARGLKEGESAFWDIFSEGQDSGSLKKIVLEAIAAMRDSADNTSKIIALPASNVTTGYTVNPELTASGQTRWLFAKSHAQGDAPQFTGLALPAELEPPRIMSMPTNLTAIASAVATISQPPATDILANNLEMRRLQDDLVRAKQELRTLHEAGRTFNQRDVRAKQYLEVLPCGILVLDELGSPVFQNEPLTKLLGRPIQKDETVEQWLSSACPNDEHREEVTALWREDVWRRQLTRTFSLATADGLLKELEFQPMSLPGGGLLINILDATEKCRHEEQLRATEAKFRSLLHESPMPVVLVDKTGAVFEVNHGAERLLGHPKNELRRYPLDAWLEPESGIARRDAMKQMHVDGQRSADLSVLVKQVNGAPLAATLHLAQVNDTRGEPHCTIHFFEQKPAALIVEEEPAAPELPPEAEVEMLLQTVATERLLFMTNVNGRIKECSEHGLTLLGLTEDEAIGLALYQYFRPSDATGFYAELTRLSESADQAHELTCFSKTGDRQSRMIRVLPRGNGGFDFELHEVVESTLEVPVLRRIDIAESFAPKTAEPSASEKRVPAPWGMVNLPREKLLLSETHHRIKNHLQIISSLLNLESNSISDANARHTLRSSQNRVRSIADLHQHLYEVAVGTTIQFTDFATGLLEHLRTCYQVPEEQVRVLFDLQAGKIQQEWLMPLALTLNETLSNAFEHAFPDGRRGEVHATLTFCGDAGELKVVDTGVGLPENLQLGTGSGLGLKILAVFAEQMRGELLFEKLNSGGTEIRLRFSIASTDI